jgi:hypothetical protein
VIKASQEYRDERTLELSTTSTQEGEMVETGEISNPNSELTVTYLFYELQRRFEVSERLHRLTPVVLVAFEVPAPDEVDEDWLIEHAWVLRRVLLDDSFRPALDSLTTSFVGEEVSVEILRAQWEAQVAVVAHIRDSVGSSGRLRDLARDALEEATQTVAGRDGMLKNLGQALFPSGPEEGDVQAAQREAAQRALEWADADLAAANSRLSATVTALRQATDDYVEAVQRRLDRRVAVDQLRLHVKQNIIYYMQAIWSHEPPDQRYFRLYDLEVEWPESSDLVQVRSVQWASLNTFPDAIGELRPAVTGELLFPPPRLGPHRPLHQIADLDSLLGFRGNYAIFPLRERNAITDYMAQSFLDSYFGVIDPDPFSEIPPASEAVEIAECAWNHSETTDEQRAEITDWLIDVLAHQDRVSEEIVVPTGQLYIEALPGSRPLLEDFKLRHRALDLERAAVGAQLQEAELLRRVARLAGGDLSDADIDRRIEIAGVAAGLEVGVDADDSEPAE